MRMLSILGAVLIAATLVVAGCGTDQNNNEELGAQISAILGNDPLQNQLAALKIERLVGRNGERMQKDKAQLVDGHSNGNDQQKP